MRLCFSHCLYSVLVVLCPTPHAAVAVTSGESRRATASLRHLRIAAGEGETAAVRRVDEAHIDTTPLPLTFWVWDVTTYGTVKGRGGNFPHVLEMSGRLAPDSPRASEVAVQGAMVWRKRRCVPGSGASILRA